MDFIDENFIDPVQTLIANSKQLVSRCEKPDYDDFTKSAKATLVGMAVLGLLGCFIKVIFIPINSVIMGK
jgi:protein transport protein SEC61 subunit gamma-like protein